MATAESAPRKPVREFRLRVMLPVVVVTVGAILLAGLGLYWAAAGADTVSVERQRRELRNAIKTGVDEVVQSQKMVAVWDEAVLELRYPKPNWDWIDGNMAFPLRVSFGHSQFYVLDPQDLPVYAMHEGARVEPELFEYLHDAVKPLIDTVRGRSFLLLERGAPDSIGLPPAPPTRNGEPPLYAAGIMSLFRRPAAVSVMRNVPLSENVSRRPGKESLIVSVRFLDSLFLLQLNSRHLIEAPRFSRNPDRQPGEEALPLVEARGEPIGYMFWKPELPGTKIMRALAPITALTIGAMILLMGLLARWLFGSMRQQSAMMDELRQSEAQAQQLALHDVLTGLPNRAMFNGQLDHAIATGQSAALLLLDLDRFKQVNDTLGHAAGDMLIREFGERLSHLVREQDMVARLGGDEFAVLCVATVEPTDIEGLCQRIVEAIREPFNLGGTNVFVGVSVGVCAVPQSGADRIDLIRKADIALYRAKAEGRDCYRMFTSEMDDSVRFRGTVEDELRIALAKEEGLIVHYQPQVRCGDQAIVGVEALVRWQHPTRGLIPPLHFISIAEETGLIRELGEWLLREACRAAQEWPKLFVAVNLSPVQFRAPDFADRMLAIVIEAGADPRRFELEVTESVLLDDDALVRQALERLRAAGFRIALDDFGTGYSSLGYLRQFQVDKIKIDRSFIEPLWTSTDAAAIVTAVLTLGHAMGLTVAAEGVETLDQQRFLVAAGCDVMQGYLYSPAVPEAAITRMISAPKEARGAA
jgi:diguanylate cyclase (GGDEF)-like protein